MEIYEFKENSKFRNDIFNILLGFQKFRNLNFQIKKKFDD